VNAPLVAVPPTRGALPFEALQIDELQLEVRRSERRKVLQLTVDRGGELIVSAPPGVSTAEMAKFVREKRFWIYTKLAEKESRQQPAKGKEFVTGEGFSYLGRSYRLLLVNEQDAPLKLSGGRFRLVRSEAMNGRKHLIQWYMEHGLPWVDRRASAWSKRMKLAPKSIGLRDLGFRWGSCSNGGTVHFHWATMLLPPSVIDYVIVHELTHLKFRNHTPEFWKHVARALPEFAERKAWLAQHGGDLVGL
jgi:predicted metal-dependent hydrolase